MGHNERGTDYKWNNITNKWQQWQVSEEEEGHNCTGVMIFCTRENRQGSANESDQEASGMERLWGDLCSVLNFV